MNVSNIKKGDHYKNYATLCEALEIKPKTGGKSKKYQVAEIERYIKYKKDRFTYIIEEVYKEPLPKMDNRRNTLPYIQYMELLLLYILKDEGNKITVSNNDLAKKLKMIHDNYAELYRDKKKMSEQLGVEVKHLYDFMDTTTSAYKNAITTILNRLERNNVIAHQKIYIVTVEVEEGKEETRPASDYEIEEIVRLKRIIMKRYGRNMKEVYENGKGYEYKSELNLALFHNLGITFHYKAYVIHAPNNFLEEEYARALQQTKLSKRELEKAGNMSFAQENERRFQDKKNRAVEKFNVNKFSGLSEMEKMRLHDNYIPCMTSINHRYINEN